MSNKKNKGKIIIISGPSGSGKTTLYKSLLSNNKNLVKSVSATTRNKRPGEIHKKDYYFVSPKMFKYKIEAGHFLEYESFFDNFYGTPFKAVRDLINSGKNVLLCIDVNGAKTVVKKYPKAIKIFIMTPTIDDLENRLVKRGSEDLETIKNRVKRAKIELKEAKNYDYIIVNDDLTKAQSILNKIVNKLIISPISISKSNPK